MESAAIAGFFHTLSGSLFSHPQESITAQIVARISQSTVSADSLEFSNEQTLTTIETAVCRTVKHNIPEELNYNLIAQGKSTCCLSRHMCVHATCPVPRAHTGGWSTICMWLTPTECSMIMKLDK
jgi:hypothetical protein